MELQLRPHQEKAVNMLRHDWKKYRTHQIYAPVAFGKTALAAFIISGFHARGMRVLFLAPYVVLVEQTAKRFIEYGLPQPGIIWRDHPWTDPDNPIQIASADTLTRRQFPDVDVVFWDESHIRRKKLLELMNDTGIPWIGLSGTPFSKWMGEYYENLIKPTTMRELINKGYLCEYEVYAPMKPNLTGVRTTQTAMGADYNENDIDEIMSGADLVGNIVQTYLEIGEDRPAICFACKVSHANFITIEFRRAGVNAEVMTAETPKEERDQIIRQFEDGITKVIVNVGVLVAGFDSDVRYIAYARPTKSEMRWIQCLGRGLRTAPGKENLIIADHSGTVHKLGFPCSIEYEELQDGSDGQDSQKSKPREKKEKLPKECPKCHYMKKPGEYVCPKCGYKPIGGEDVETDESRGLEKITGESKKATKEEKQRFYSELLGWKQERGRNGKPVSDGYVANLYKAKFKVWPRNLNESIMQPTPATRGFIKSRQIAYAKSMDRKK